MADIDTVAINQSVDLRDLAGGYTTLRKWAAGELAGPCPKCGGTDRFHVKADSWCCYQCHPWGDWGGDAIGFVMWLDGLDFRAACERLGRSDLPAPAVKREPARKEKARVWPGAGWQQEAAAIVARSQDRIKDPQGAAVRDYLEGRGLEPETWDAWGIGAAALHGREAVVMPWYWGPRISALKYRFTKADSKADRFTQKAGGEQRLFGLQNTRRYFDVLILAEGEFNAMSLWQAARGIGFGLSVDVVSFGGESGDRAHDYAVELAGRYRAVILWADKGDVARELAARIGPKAQGLRSPRGQDANDLLHAGNLGDFLRLALGKASAGDTVHWAGGEYARWFVESQGLTPETVKAWIDAHTVTGERP